MKRKELLNFMEEKWYKRHPIFSCILLAEVIGVLFCGVDYVQQGTQFAPNDLIGILFLGMFVGVFFVLPVTGTLLEAVYFVLSGKRKEQKWNYMLLDLMMLGLGVVYEMIYMVVIKQIELFADWNVQLANLAAHAAIATQSLPTIILIALLAFAGYLVLMLVPLEKMPPLVVVLSISAMYLGTIETILLAVQIFDRKEPTDFYLFLLPANCILVIARILMEKIKEWQTISMEKMKIYEKPVLNFCDKLLNKAALWPVYAFFLMFPLLGVLIMILVLFGQAPDSVIRAWTETSDWNLSLKEAPQNIYYDEHYLCTVAAGGHKKVVKPIRAGVRHGHRVIVNRQLCIANAFEQVLEERTPHFHRVVRDFYDTCGFPVAKLIRSKYMADIVYFLMKPLEWIFLIVLYLVDVKPENRIAVQYMGEIKRKG